MRALELEGLNECRKTPGIVRHSKRVGWVRRSAAARRVPGHHVELGREIFELSAPNPAVAEEAVKKNQRRPFADAFICDAKLANLKCVPCTPSWHFVR
jgi:hypothetical protein